jgi:hypothetical protein
VVESCPPENSTNAVSELIFSFMVCPYHPPIPRPIGSNARQAACSAGIAARNAA